MLAGIALGAEGGTPGETDGLSRASGSGPGRAVGQSCLQPAGNCQAGDNATAHTSNGVEFLVTDDFIPATGGSITRLCWRGAYYDFDRGADCSGDVVGDAFEIRYFADAGGAPGPLIAWWRQLAGSLNVDGRTSTGNLIAQQANEYEYTATHDPVPIEGGQCYWVEISNEVDASPGCTWLWEGSAEGNDWSLQDDEGDGYGMDDALPTDSAFCLNLPLDDAETCLPQPPPNDDCADAEPISGEGPFPFDDTTARTDGPRHAACQAFGEDQLEADVWYCWTAPCTHVGVISTCGLTQVDTRVAVYAGCDVCPPGDANLLTCNDDRCGDVLEPRQSLATFNAVEGQDYLIRIGVYPGERRGTGSFTLTCTPPDQPNCPGTGDCCDQAGTGTVGCDDETCCEVVCMCDPFCCEVAWDDSCAIAGWLGAPGCGAELLCPTVCDVCGSSEVDCCVGAASGSRIAGCSDPTCCEAVCAVDRFCCDVEWDEECATYGFEGNGNGARILCPNLCGGFDCPDVEITWLEPQDGVVDARQPYPPGDANQPQGIDSFLVAAPVQAAPIYCWDVCETDDGGSPNEIASVTVEGGGRLRIGLARPITPGAVTTVVYRGNGRSINVTSHPGNVNGDAETNQSDVREMVNVLTGASDPLWGLYSADIDHSGALGPGDLLRVIDLISGSDAFAPGWKGSLLPSNGAPCPP